jgi:regulatory protein
MPETDDYKRLLSISLKLLSIRPRSQKEIETYLNKKTQDRNLINQVVDRLKSAKFLDDAKFAQWVIESRSRTRPRGKRLLIQELKSKGVDVSAEDFSGVNEIDLACKALQKKAKSWSYLSANDYRLKAISYLRLRGFSWDAIEKAIKKGYNKEHVS